MARCRRSNDLFSIPFPSLLLPFFFPSSSLLVLLLLLLFSSFVPPIWLSFSFPLSLDLPLNPFLM
jgi:hypothetical protein